jgi:site-specific DNA-methyltransferase (adenine-specific)
VPKKNAHRPKPLYRQKPPSPPSPPSRDTLGHPVPVSHFKLNDDGSVLSTLNSQPSTPGELFAPQLVFRSDNPFLRLYHADCLTLLDAIAAKYPAGRFDAIFADPPYFLSNGGITCHAGRMVKVDKGDWDKSRGPELNHEFNVEWLRRCQRVLKPNGTIWVSGTHHVIFSIGYALQSLGYKILNDIAWEKPNPPPNLSCRYFTHSTETLLWAARDDKSKHTFNYQEMRKVTGKQMKTVWRRGEFEVGQGPPGTPSDFKKVGQGAPRTPEILDEEAARSENVALPESIWTINAPTSAEKLNGKHPTQKPLALLERCLLASTNPGDLVLDPFLGGGTTAVACVRLKRGCVGIELDEAHAKLAVKRIEDQIGTKHEN